ncbi:glycosyltransferase [Candidatus Gottesmanbacteria bacterium]|nr:glycosyltransferase [Candidatus Gottesmanbacteria bacterium]
MLPLLIISSYPAKGYTHGKGTVGIASYAKNTLLGIKSAAKKEANDLEITVLAEKLGDTPSQYIENNINVNRSWKRNSIFSYINLMWETVKRPSYNTVLFEFELAMFGGALSLIPLPFFLLILKILGKKVFLVSHQVVVDINSMANHVGIKPKGFKTKILNYFIGLFYRLTLATAFKVIVFEEYLKNELGRFGDKDKILVIPHGVEEFKSKITYTQARKQLGIRNEFAILYFGFIAWYKGTDWIVEEVLKNKGKNIKLIIAGGANPNHADKKFYLDYIKSIQDKAKNSNGKIEVTGFVNEADISKYFIVSDIVALPYRTFMSSSGPLSIALSFNKPFIVSDKLEGIFQNQDMKLALKSARLKKEDFIFNFSDKGFIKDLLQKYTKSIKRIQIFADEIKTQRSFEKIGRIYLENIYEKGN